MKVRVLSVGKPKEARMAALHDMYAERIRRLGVEYDTSFVKETRTGGRFSDGHVRQREARGLREALEGRGTVVALEPSGELLGSRGLAERLERWATPLVTFVIGGPLGLHPELSEAAHVSWSLSPLTLPHDLVRVVLAEQIYRALTITRGIPYHK